MEKVRFAVIGSGHIGKRHAEMVDRNPRAELVAMCDRRSKDDCLVPYDVPFFNDVDEMLDSGLEFDVVCVCTPNGLHAEHAIKSLRKRKHVVIEKPMGLSKAECEEVIYAALNASRQVFCVMQNRYSPPSMWLKDVVSTGILVEIYMVQINCYWNRDDRYYNKVYWKGTGDLDGGTLFTQFSHFIDIMYWLFGDITNIHARFRDFKHAHNTDFEDSGLATFEFVNGGLGCLNFSTAINDKNFESSITIIAEKGTVKVGGQYMNEVEYCHIEGYEMPVLAESNPANDYGDYKGSAANHVYIVDNVIENLLGDKEITTNALEGLKVVEMIERIYESGQRVIKKASEKEAKAEK
jgi:UDP-N-acetyl-2-amino-2-deoxyglucuronate dehydrogenase